MKCVVWFLQLLLVILQGSNIAKITRNTIRCLCEMVLNNVCSAYELPVEKNLSTE